MADTDQKTRGAGDAQGAVRELLIVGAFALGWLLLTLGIWGAAGRQWWIWALSLGLGSLVVGAALVWVAAQEAAAKVRTLLGPEAGAASRPQRPVPISSAGGRPA